MWRLMRRLIRQDELVLRREAKPIRVAAVRNDDFARPEEQVAAVDPVIHDRNITPG
jgi:hypothetical protein